MSFITSYRSTLLIILGLSLAVCVAFLVVQMHYTDAVIIGDKNLPICTTSDQNETLFRRFVLKDDQRSSQELTSTPAGKVENESKEFIDRYDRTNSNKVERPIRRLPGAIIIGVKKGGTRALLSILSLHPEVVSARYEPHFFDTFYDKGLEWYRSQMPYSYASQLTIEKTPKYLVDQDVPRRVYNFSRSVQLLLVVRDPVTRALSEYAQVVSHSSQNISSFEERAFRNYSTGLVVNTEWIAIQLGLYANHLEHWTKYFPLSRIHVVSGERLVDDPVQELKAVEKFLGIRPIIDSRHFVFNQSKGFFCLLSHSSHVPHCLKESKGRPHPQISRIDLQRLRDFFRPFNQIFYRMVGRDFGWP